MPNESRVRGDLKDYIGANGLPQFQLYLDALHDYVTLLEDHDHLGVERLEVQLRDRLVLEDDADESGEHLGMLVRGWVRIRRACIPGTLFGDLLTIATPRIKYDDGDARVRR